MALMDIKNPGGISLDFFENLRVIRFVDIALNLLNESHYDITQLEPAFVATLGNLEHTPNSKKYTKLAGQLLAHNLIARVCTCTCPCTCPHEFRLKPNEPFAVLSLFAVVKEVSGSKITARPIENGRPLTRGTKAQQLHEELQDFHLCGAPQIVEVLRMVKAGMSAYHLDFANYYFQFANKRPMQHIFRIGGELFCWLVLTMGWTAATRIAQACTAAIVLRGWLLTQDKMPALIDQVIVPDVIFVDSTIIVIIYDSVLIFDYMARLPIWQAQIRESSRQANAKLKYDTIEPVPSQFEFCGFEIRTTLHGVEWRIAPELVQSWKELAPLLSASPTPRTLWKVAGYLQFAFTVLELPARPLGPIRRVQSLLGLVAEQGWDTTNAEVAQVLPYAAQRCLTVGNAFRHGRTRKRQRSRTTLYFACDATPAHWGWYRLDEHGKILGQDSGPRAFQSIDEGEACAMCEALLEATRIDPSGTAIWVIVADNTSVSRAFTKASSAADSIYNEIKRCNAAELAAVFIIADIRSDGNLADVISRPNESFSSEEIANRTAETVDAMSRAIDQWERKGLFFVPRTKAAGQP